MNINIKNCEVKIITGTDTLEINGGTQPAAAEAPAESTRPAATDPTRPAEYKEGGFISEMTYSVSAFMANRDKVRRGDRVRIPGFKVPAAEIDGEEKLNFDEIEVAGEYATVYKIEGEQISLVFDRALFKSVIDRNNTGVWEDTQLAAYLRGAFLDALRKKTSAADCGLLHKEELWGYNALPFFRNGRNRVCFDKDEDCSIWYWTETVENASVADFCTATNDGFICNYYASNVNSYVRPRFIIHKS